MKNEFIIYPKTKIETTDPKVVILEAPRKVKMKAYITGYTEDYGELPSIEQVRSIFRVSEQDAEIALVVYKPD
ncbi:hypothetical protein [Sporosarcina sp. FSL K6-2383]|uniref:hypothetical protein n=1 Tax=Sporosarcina sp. FSL K6-2383 TaxID=2921556 RepID=UPI00315A1772